MYGPDQLLDFVAMCGNQGVGLVTFGIGQSPAKKTKTRGLRTARLAAPQMKYYNQAATESASVGVAVAVSSSGKSANPARAISGSRFSLYDS